MANCLISLGANVGDCSQSIEAALQRLKQHPEVVVVKRSRLLSTKPAGGPTGQSDFVNAAALIETALEPQTFLRELQEIESQAGRNRKVRWGERTLDLDLILWGNVVSSDRQLILPHPRMAFRRFVLEPAVEVAATMRHPVTRHTVAEMLQHLDSAPNYIAVTGVAATGKANLVLAACERVDAVPLVSETLPDAGLSNDANFAALTTELELLRSRIECLTSVQEKAKTNYVMSNFWLGQSLAYLQQTEIPSTSNLQVECQKRLLHAPLPKLVVLVERNFEPANTPAKAVLEKRQQALQELLLQSGQPPTLRLDASEPDWNVEEVVAAIHAM